jgi:DNA-binding HxlR family transcriptional regulator
LEPVIGTLAFPDEHLDSKDRGLLIILYECGPKGMGFNRLVKKASPLASRSTVALRVRRLTRLGYVERIPSQKGDRTRPVRISFRCHSLMSAVTKLREKTEELSTDLIRLDSALKSQKRGGLKAKTEAFRGWHDAYRAKFNGLFGMAGSVAVMFGTTAAGDLFLPLIVDDYKRLWSQFVGIVRDSIGLAPSLRSIVGDELRAEGTSLEDIKQKVRKEMNEWRQASAA